LHLGKTGTKSKLNKAPNLSISWHCVISNITTVNHLGFVLDNDLSGTSMAMKVLGKVNAKTKFLAKCV